MLLRIVTWNCAAALHDKYERLLALNPDVAVVPECAEPAALRRLTPGFAFTDLRLRLHHSWPREFHHLLPIEVRSHAVAMRLLAVWAFDHSIPPKLVPNPKTTELAVAHYAPFLRAAPAVVAGDLNASVSRCPRASTTICSLEPSFGLGASWLARAPL